MAKRLYELAAELGMRSERLMELLKRQGMLFGSAFEQIDPQAEAEVRRVALSERSLWEKLKTRFFPRSDWTDLQEASFLSDKEEEQLEALVERNEQLTADVELEPEPESEDFAFETMEDSLPLWQPEARQEQESVPIWSPLESTPEPEPESEHLKETPIKPVRKEEPRQKGAEIPVSEPQESFQTTVEDSIADDDLEEPSAPIKSKESRQDAADDQVPLAAAVTEQPLDSILDLSLDIPKEDDSRKTAMPPPLTADELLEKQLAGFESDIQTSPQDASKSALEKPVSSVQETRQKSESFESVAEDESMEQEEEQPAAMPEASMDSGTVTIDQLLGMTDVEEEEPEEVPVEAVREKPSLAASPIEGELLDTQSLLGLEFPEDSAGGKKDSKPEPKKAPDEGVGVQELLGLEEHEEKPETESKPSRLAPMLHALTGHFKPLFHPGQFLQSLSNLELIFASLIFLTTLSGAFYAYYRWHNYHRPGVDQRFFDWGERLRSAGLHSDAIEKYRLLLRYHPESELVRQTYLGLADSLYQSGRYQEAIPEYERALTLYEKGVAEGMRDEDFPDFRVIPQARFNLTRSLLKVGFYEKARENLTQLASQFPGREIGEESRMILGDLYTQWAKEEQRPEKLRNAIAEYHLALNEYPQSTRKVELMFKLGNAYLDLYHSLPTDEKDGNLLEEAIVEFKNAVTGALAEGRSVDEVARYRIAWADAKRLKGETPVAIETYEKLLQQELPLDLKVETLEKVARSYLALDDYGRAERWSQELIDSNPGDSARALAYYVLGDAEWERPDRDFTKMMQYYQKALDLDDQSGPDGAHSQRAFMRMTNVLYLVEQQYEEAARKYRVIIEKYPNGPYTYRAKFLLAESLEKQGKYLEAADAYQQCIDDYVTSEFVSLDNYRESFYRRADCLFAAGQWAEAVGAYQAALQELGFPDTEEAIAARQRLAASYIALQNYPRAERILENLLERYPQANEQGQFSFALGDTREKMFDYHGAREIYLDLLKKSQDDAVVEKAYSRLASSYLMQVEGSSEEEANALRLAALGVYREMQRRFPAIRWIELEIGKIHQAQGDRIAAERHLTNFLSHATAEDAQAEASVLLGELAWAAGRGQEALEHFQLVDRLPVIPGDKPWRARATYRLAETLRQSGHLNSAKEHYERVLADFSDSPWAKDAEWKLNTVDWQMSVTQDDSRAAS